MFTGIIGALGKVAALTARGGDLRIRIEAPHMPWQDVAIGDSIATNGVCLTVVALPGDGYVADVSVETINATTLNQWKVGDRVNLEKALTPTSRMGGHMVSGHVDGVGEILMRTQDARSERFQVRVPKSLAKYIAHKGSVTVDGTSLTVNAVDGDVFDLNIVPHTLDHTIMGRYKPGHLVNIEVDVIARYLERLLLGDNAATKHPSSTLTEDFLTEHGYQR